MKTTAIAFGLALAMLPATVHARHTKLKRAHVDQGQPITSAFPRIRVAPSGRVISVMEKAQPAPKQQPATPPPGPTASPPNGAVKSDKPQP